MSGVDIIGALLRGSDTIAAAVPVERIKAGSLPDNTVLPALLVRSVSLVERQMLRRGTWVRQSERIAVTVRAGSYREQREILRLVRNVCAGQLGALAGLGSSVSSQSAGTGPDVRGPADSFEQTQDFKVSFNALT
ncbi:hypothetical protein QCD71_12370 [Sphingomonas sp. PsM26]|nr:hypothetical protein [Sphingomonas sp. PsM26]